MADNKLIDIKAILELLKDWKIALATTIATLVLFILKIKHFFADLSSICHAKARKERHLSMT